MGDHKKEGPVAGNEVLDIPMEQILADPHQPRTKFKEGELDELAGSIRSQGLQQLPVVNYAFRKDGLDYYYLKAGERRWRAHKKEGLPSMPCIVAKEPYDGKRDVNRRLAQAAENSSRVPHTHSEIVEITEDIVNDETSKRVTKYGAIEIALDRVAVAFGRKRSWANNYHTLAGLLPELREMLDDDDDGERLNFQVGISLARAPSDTQVGILKEAEAIFRKRGHAAGYAFIVRRVREIREERGEKIRTRNSDDRARFLKIPERLIQLSEAIANGLYGDRKTSARKDLVEGYLKNMSEHEVVLMLSDISYGLQIFLDLRQALQEKKNQNKMKKNEIPESFSLGRS